jgi:hypothetical protein
MCRQSCLALLPVCYNYSTTHATRSIPFPMTTPNLFRSPFRPDISLRKATYFYCNYWRDYIAGTFAFYIVSNSVPRPLVNAVQHRWNTRERKGLWWLVVCKNDVYPKATLRQHQKRRLRNAFRDALKENGWDNNGIPLVSAHQPTKPLSGSVQLVVRPGMAQIPFVDLQKQCSATVQDLLQQQGKFLAKPSAGTSVARKAKVLSGLNNGKLRTRMVNSSKDGNDGSSPREEKLKRP